MFKRTDFIKHAPKITRWIDQYFHTIEDFPVKSRAIPKQVYDEIPDTAPEEGESLEVILEDLDKTIMPGITHWQHPNFHAYFNANSSVESVFAETITAAIGAQCMIWDTSPAAAELEERMMEWLQKAMVLPADFEGVIQDSASSATLTALLTAREVKTNFSSNETGVPNNLRVYCSTETHSSVEKAVGICGIGRKNLIKIPVNESMSLITEELEKQIQLDIDNGLVPCCAVATLGTTGTMAIDPLAAIGVICKKYGLWLHVDAAQAGSALLLPEYRWISKGMENADSFVFNPHKWLFTNFDCSAYFVKDTSMLIRTFDILPEYLKTDKRGTVKDFRDWGIPLGRRFRALKLWFVLRGYGLKTIRGILRHHISLNDFFAKEINKRADFEMVQEPFLNFSCFRYKPSGVDNKDHLNALNKELLKNINDSGKAFISHTTVRGDTVLRMVIGQTYVEEKHVKKTLEAIFSSALKLDPSK
ncbi:MAG: aminotransferase class V-fold PLP-dependent enzyme [Cyclobacteriaceae bacterium]|nr:aminotransferase class V-fold PLP-dependent enzyme [Cyclobacteriaceae bacterium]